ncbi:hypothetical protein ACU41F_004809 [Klebsiella aerogenes]
MNLYIPSDVYHNIPKTLNDRDLTVWGYLISKAIAANCDTLDSYSLQTAIASHFGRPRKSIYNSIEKLRKAGVLVKHGRKSITLFDPSIFAKGSDK